MIYQMMSDLAVRERGSREDRERRGVWILRWDAKLDLQTAILITDHHTEDDPLVFESGGPHEEGWSSTHESYWMDETGVVWSATVDDGCDCDGRLTHYWAGFWNGRGWVTSPDGCHQRDYQAEAAGY